MGGLIKNLNDHRKIYKQETNTHKAKEYLLMVQYLDSMRQTYE